MQIARALDEITLQRQMYYKMVNVRSDKQPCSSSFFGLNTHNIGTLLLPHKPNILEKHPAARTLLVHEFFRGCELEKKTKKPIPLNSSLSVLKLFHVMAGKKKKKTFID